MTTPVSPGALPVVGSCFGALTVSPRPPLRTVKAENGFCMAEVYPQTRARTTPVARRRAVDQAWKDLIAA
jgi:hypothetical protein